MLTYHKDHHKYELIILTYHRVLLQKEIDNIQKLTDRIYITETTNFEKHCEYLRSMKQCKLTLKEILKNNCQINNKTYKKHVVLSFDDGYEDNYFTVYPILLNFGLKATFFLSTDFIEEKGYMKWKQIREMHKAGMEFQSHTHTHPDLDKMNNTQIFKELTISKQIIENKLNEQINIISLPYGSGNRKIKNIALNAGYEYVCTSDWGINKINNCTHLLKRFSIKSNYNFKKFKLFVDGKKSLLLLFYQAKNKPLLATKKILGKDTYDKIRHIILNRMEILK